MPQPVPAAPPFPTQLLLIEADADARERHTQILQRAGYQVEAVPAFPSIDELQTRKIILSDEPSFYWLQDSGAKQVVDRVRVLVLTDDVRAGVTACLCGAADWLPVASDPEYLLNTVREAARNGKP